MLSLEGYEKVSDGVAHALSCGCAFSYLRCGDGEGHFLHFRSSEASIRTMAWRGNFFYGTSDIPLKDFWRTSDCLKHAMEVCNWMGVNLRFTVSELRRKAKQYASDANGYSGLLYLYDEIDRLGLKDKIVSAHLPLEFLRRGKLYEWIAIAKKVVVVTGRTELVKVLPEIFGDKFQFLITNPEYNFSDRAGKNSQNLSQTLHELHKGVSENCGPNVLVLVGAGVIGKGLCATAQQQGSVVIDCGAIFDAMVGMNTRDYFSSKLRWPEHKVLSQDSELLLTSNNVFRLTNGRVSPKGEVTASQILTAAERYFSSGSAQEDGKNLDALTLDELLAEAHRMQSRLSEIERSRTYRLAMYMTRVSRWIRRIH